MLTVACVWVEGGEFDGPDWVWKLYRMVDRRIGMVHRPFKFVCISPHAADLRNWDWLEVVEPSIIPPSNLKKHWFKLNLFGLEGDQILYFDLDTVILDSIVPLIEFPSDFVTAPSSGVPMRGNDFNSSVMSWRPSSDPIKFIRSKLAHVPYSNYAGDQQWLASLPMRVDLYPSRWIRKYLPKGGVKRPDPGTIVSLLIQGGKNNKLIEDGHTWIADYWR